MSFFEVVQEACTKCGICGQVCPAGILKVVEGKSSPRSFAGAENMCLTCGHCVAVCPEGAFSLKAMPAEACPPIQKNRAPDAGQVELLLRSRRSIRNYKEQPVDRERLSELIRVASHAPSGHNAQPLKWGVIYEREQLMKLGGMVIDWMRHLMREQPDMAKNMHLEFVVAGWEKGRDVIFRNAPHVVFTKAHKNNPFAPAASTIALSYMELAAPSLDLGACWLGYFQSAVATWPPLAEALELSEKEICLGALAIGIPKFSYHRLPLRNEPSIQWC